MSGRELAIPREIVVTFNRIWQRCSSQCYAAYIRRGQDKSSYRNLNQLASIALGVITLALIVAVAVVAWEEVISLTY